MTAYRKGTGPFEMGPPARPVPNVILIELLSFFAVVAIATTVLVLSFFFYPQNSNSRRSPDRSVTPILSAPSERSVMPASSAAGATTAPDPQGANTGSASPEPAATGKPPEPAEPGKAATESGTAGERPLPEIEPASGGSEPQAGAADATPFPEAGGAPAERFPVIEAKLPPEGEPGNPDHAGAREPPLSTPAAASPSAPAEPVAPEEIEQLIARGDQLLGIGDVVAARRFYERAAGSANGAAAVGVGKTFDPVFLAQTGARGVRGDAAEAASWYRRASKAGNREADRRLRILIEKFPE